MGKELHVSQLSPDGYSRFFFLVDILLQAYGTSSDKIKILDVGGCSEFFEQQLKESGLQYDLTVLDMLPKPLEITSKYIQADATAMAIKDDSFDVVVSTDVIEHISQDRKQAFLSECVRVAREICIIAGPFDTLGVHEAEVTVNEFNKKLFGSGQNWLEEHMEFGKPSLSMFENVLKTMNITYDNFGTQNITTWLLNTHINLIEAKLGLDTEVHHKINTCYGNNILAMNETGSPTYRHFFLIYKQAEIKKRINLKKYLNVPVDYAAYSQYVGSLIELLSSRIQQLGQENSGIVKSLGVEKEVLYSQNEALKKIIQEQQQTLHRFEPLLRITHSKYVSLVRRLFRSITKTS